MRRKTAGRGIFRRVLTLLGVFAAWIALAIPLNAAQLAPTNQQAAEPVWPQVFYLYAGKVTTFGFVVTQAGTVTVTVSFQGQPIAVTVQPWPAVGSSGNASPTLPAAGSKYVVVTLNLTAADVSRLGYLWQVTIAQQSATATSQMTGWPPVVADGQISIQHPPVDWTLSAVHGAIAQTLYANMGQANTAALTAFSKVSAPFMPPKLVAQDPRLLGVGTTVATNVIGGVVRPGVNPVTLATSATVGPVVPPNQPVSPIKPSVPVRSITGALPTTTAPSTPPPSPPPAPAPPPAPSGVTLSGISGGVAWDPFTQRLECTENLMNGWGWTFPGNCPATSQPCPAGMACDWAVSQFDVLDIRGAGFQLGDQIHFRFGGQDFAAPCPTGWTCPWYNYTMPGSSGYVSPSEIVAAVPNIQGLPETVGTLYLQRGIQQPQNFGSLPVIFKPAQDVTLLVAPEVQVNPLSTAPATRRDLAGTWYRAYRVHHEPTGIFVPAYGGVDVINATLPANSTKKIESVQILQPDYSNSPAADPSSFYWVSQNNASPTATQTAVEWVAGAGRTVDYIVMVTAVDTRGK
jgi:hypothetical protein